MCKSISFFFFNNFIYLFIFWLCWVFVSVQGLSLVVASGGHSSSRYTGLSLSRPLLLQSTGSRRAGSVVVAHGPSRSAACGILPDQGSNPCPLLEPVSPALAGRFSTTAPPGKPQFLNSLYSVHQSKCLSLYQYSIVLITVSLFFNFNFINILEYS